VDFRAGAARVECVGFGGANVGYKSRMLGYMNSGQGVVVMTNSENGGELIAEILRCIRRERLSRTAGSRLLLVTQRFNRIESGGFARRIVTEENSDCD
jgi:hypothetical protein